MKSPYNCSLEESNHRYKNEQDLSRSIKSAGHKTQYLGGRKRCRKPPESISSWAFWKKDK